MELNTISLSDFVKLATVIWNDSYDSVKQSMLESGLVKKVTIPQNTGNSREFSSIDTNEYLAYKGESDQAARGQIQQGFTNTMISYRVAENIGISYEMRTQNKYPEVVARISGSARKGANRKDLDLSHRITFGTATSYVDIDGRTIDITTGASSTQQLFDSNHPLNGSPTTYRNRLANNPKVSKGALEGMERLVTENTFNHLGEKVTAKFDILYSTDDPNAVNTIREHLRSTAAPDGAHSGVFNVNMSKYRHVVLPRVNTTAVGAPDTKRDYWGIASSSMSSFFCGIWEEPRLIPPAANDNSEDVQTDDWDFRIRMGMGITIVDAAWIKFSSGDGVA